MLWRTSITTLCAFVCIVSVLGQDAPQPDEKTIVQVSRIVATGSRFSTLSIVHLMGISAGDKVNDELVRKACGRLTSTGLFKSIDYEYLMYPDKPGVQLTLKIVDEGGLVPARIDPDKDDESLWPALQQLDPVFTRQMPPNEKAINFYAENLNHCLKAMGREDEYAAPTVTGDAGQNPTAVVFKIRHYKKTQ